MMEYHLPTIADIQTTDLLYFDAAHRDECYRFCEARDIDYLPDASNPEKYHHRNSSGIGFKEKDITDEHRLDAATYIFQQELVTRFRESPVQFVFANGILCGVAHFSDYNREAVYTHLYTELTRYERDLRELLRLYKLTNDDMCACFLGIIERNKKKEKKQDTVRVYTAKLDDYISKREQLAKLPPFQGFYLDDLRILAKGQGLIVLTDIKDLRNTVMHIRDSVEQRDANIPDFVYEKRSFATFFDLVQKMLTDRRRIRTRLLIQSGLTS